MSIFENSTNVRFAMSDAAAAIAALTQNLTGGLTGGLRSKSAVDRAALAFLTPARHIAPPAMPEPAGGAVLAVPGRSPHLAARLWTPTGGAAAPAILLMHGWAGQSYDMMPFVQPLLDRGFRVVTFDAPAHGRSAGDISNLPDFARAIADVARVVGPLAGAIGHSMGAAALILAAEAGVTIPKIAVIGAPTRPMRYLMATARSFGLGADEQMRLADLVSRVAGRAIETIDTAAIVPGITAQGLVVHSIDDRTVRLADGLELAGAWAGSQIHLVEGLGHRRILKDAGVIARVASFLGTPST